MWMPAGSLTRSWSGRSDEVNHARAETLPNMQKSICGEAPRVRSSKPAEFREVRFDRVAMPQAPQRTAGRSALQPAVHGRTARMGAAAIRNLLSYGKLYRHIR